MGSASDVTSKDTMTDAEIRAAKQIWEEYQRQHDVSDRKGQIAGIDPHTGHVWIGEWFDDVLAQRDAAGIDNILFFERVGYPTAIRKGGRR